MFYAIEREREKFILQCVMCIHFLESKFVCACSEETQSLRLPSYTSTLTAFKWSLFSIDWNFVNEVTMVHNADDDDEWLRSTAASSFHYRRDNTFQEVISMFYTN